MFLPWILVFALDFLPKCDIFALDFRNRLSCCQQRESFTDRGESKYARRDAKFVVVHAKKALKQCYKDIA